MSAVILGRRSRGPSPWIGSRRLGAKAVLGGAVRQAEETLGISISCDRASPLGVRIPRTLLPRPERLGIRSLLRADRLEAAYSLVSAAAASRGKIRDRGIPGTDHPQQR
ncbi:MAG: hypothetical protein MZU97_18940 [Bacillus subtilis]|nr:hypothetical protein [Bacillus subtilis]